MQRDDGTPMAVYVHDERGRVELTATPDGMRLSRTFDDDGRVHFQQDPDGRSLRCTTAHGPVAPRSSPNDGHSSVEYDELDRLTAATSRGVGTHGLRRRLPQ
jgi:YD repeat-containing protein